MYNIVLFFATDTCHCMVFGPCMVYLMVYEVFLKFNCNSTADGSRVDYLKMSESELFIQYSSEVAKLKFLHPEKLSENRVGQTHFLLKSNISCTEKVSFY